MDNKAISHDPRGRILLVDDEASVLNEYGRWLEGAGFKVTKAHDGRAALRSLGRERFDVVFSDASPGIDAIALVKRVRDRGLEVPLVLMSNDFSNDAAIRAAQHGVIQYLQKPIEREALERIASFAVSLRRRQHGGPPVATVSFTATDAKNEFGRVLEAAMQKGAVVITKHDAPKAVLLSMDEFNALAGRRASLLDALSEEFDAMLVRMQTSTARKGMKAAFDATPAELARAAVAAAREGG